MSETKPFKIALCGISERDAVSISIAIKLSQGRARQYQITADVKETPDIYLVDDTLEGWAVWRSLQQRHSNPSAPVLLVGQGEIEPPAETVHRLAFKRPIVVTRLLSTLDDLILAFFGKGLEISDNVSIGEIRAVADAEQAAPKEKSGKRVLVVDDSESVRKLMQVKLAGRGLRVDFAEDGESALQMARGFDYDLIFLDVMLPGMDGYSVCRHLKKDYKTEAAVVMLTSRASRLDKMRGMLIADADDYLTKPLSTEDLNATLSKYLDEDAGANTK